MGFKNLLIVEEKAGSEGKWTVYKSFEYDIDADRKIVVPSGFVTDFASIPRGFWNILPPTGKYRGAAVVHDFLYSRRGQYHPTKPALTRAESDRVFLSAMKDLKVPWLTRRIMYLAVRGFGWISYPRRENP